MSGPATYLTLGEAARVLGISEDTLRRWSDAGKIASTRHPTSKHRRFRTIDVEDKRRELAAFSENTPQGFAS